MVLASGSSKCNVSRASVMCAVHASTAQELHFLIGKFSVSHGILNDVTSGVLQL